MHILERLLVVLVMVQILFPRAKGFMDNNVLKFTDDEGLMATFKWIVHTQKMVFMLDLVPNKRAQSEFLSHQKIGNALTWWQGVEVNLDTKWLVVVTVQEF